MHTFLYVVWDDYFNHQIAICNSRIFAYLLGSQKFYDVLNSTTYQKSKQQCLLAAFYSQLLVTLLWV